MKEIEKYINVLKQYNDLQNMRVAPNDEGKLEFSECEDDPERCNDCIFKSLSSLVNCNTNKIIWLSKETYDFTWKEKQLMRLLAEGTIGKDSEGKVVYYTPTGRKVDMSIYTFLHLDNINNNTLVDIKTLINDGEI